MKNQNINFGSQFRDGNSDLQIEADLSNEYFIRPSISISHATIERLVAAGVDPVVANIDLELAKLLLESKESWSNQRCIIGELEYKRFLTLHLWNQNIEYPLVPTTLIDMVWHMHLLDTRAYFEDMSFVFGDYLHHFPYLGFIGEESKRLKKSAFVKFCNLYEWTFGESYMQSLIDIQDE